MAKKTDGTTKPKKKQKEQDSPEPVAEAATVAEVVVPKRRKKPSLSEKLARRCAALALEKKALNPVVLDLREKSSFTDFFVIASGTSDRHVGSIATGIEETLSREGVRALGMEGLPTGQWVLVDYGDVVVHVFYSATRTFYDLESLWIDAPRLKLTRTAPRKKKTAEAPRAES